MAKQKTTKEMDQKLTGVVFFSGKFTEETERTCMCRPAATTKEGSLAKEQD
jgi:hypothetical protein